MMDDLDPKEFEDTARAVIGSCTDADDTGARARLLAEAGLLGVIAPETIGGLDLPMRFAVPIAIAAGEGLLAFPLIEELLLSKALAEAAPEIATAIAAGETVAIVAWTGTAERGVVGGAPLARDASHVLVFREDGRAILADRQAGIEVEEGPTLDLETPEATLRVSHNVTGVEIDDAAVQTLREDAIILRAAFVLGSAAHCLSLAANYAQERVQFGKPLSANQVLRHRLSRDALAIETIRNGIARALTQPTEGCEIARNAAWLQAAQAGPGVAESAIQVFGGMGFTWEVPLHRHLRQMRSQAAQGAAMDTLDAIGAELLRGPKINWYEEIADVV